MRLSKLFAGLIGFAFAMGLLTGPLYAQPGANGLKPEPLYQVAKAKKKSKTSKKKRAAKKTAFNFPDGDKERLS
ncbi:MAG: hypothetical protein HY580_01715 [Nitrospinae bacterium]|nr:hypothetical protein [Nitrospinota bacterium]